MNVEPSPGMLSARISPPWEAAIWRDGEPEAGVPDTHEVLREAEPDGTRRPAIHVGGR